MPTKKTTKRVVKEDNFIGANGYTDKEWETQQRWNELEIPHLRGGDWKWNFEKKPMSLTDKITWVITVVNIAILISLVIKNV